MALDTRDKRGSALNPQSPWRGQWPMPDGSLDQADRQHALWSYRGILAGPAVPPQHGPLWVVAGGVWSDGAVAGGAWVDGAVAGEVLPG